MNKNRTFRYNSVMLIDDGAVDNFINEKLIRYYFFSDKVYVHTSAKSALEFFKNIEKIGSIPESLIPDYIFLDLNMPMIDGWGFLQEYERLDLSFDCKIVVLTASVDPNDKERAKKIKNIIDFFCKPLSEEMLKSL
ncbi:MAG: response regulator [Bacteroidota bacterium]